jgi:hypothetical protein
MANAPNENMEVNATKDRWWQAMMKSVTGGGTRDGW